MKKDAVVRLIVAALFPAGRGIVPGAVQYRQTRVFWESGVGLRLAAEVEAATARTAHETRELARLAEPGFTKRNLFSA